jgi:hypothetical protein
VVPAQDSVDGAVEAAGLAVVVADEPEVAKAAVPMPPISAAVPPAIAIFFHMTDS